MLSLDGFEPVTITQPTLAMYARGSPQLRIGDTAINEVNLSTTGCAQNSGASLPLTIVNSNPDAVTVPSTVDLPWFGSLSFPTNSVGLGVSTVTILPPDGFAASPSQGAITFSSRPKR